MYIEDLSKRLYALEKKSRQKSICYSATALSGIANSCQILGIDKSSGDLYYKALDGTWQLTTASGGGGGGTGITALTGDVTASGTDSVVATLKTVNSNVGSFTNANITVNAKGLITAVSNGSAGGDSLISADKVVTTSTDTNYTISAGYLLTKIIVVPISSSSPYASYVSGTPGDIQAQDTGNPTSTSGATWSVDILAISSLDIQISALPVGSTIVFLKINVLN